LVQNPIFTRLKGCLFFIHYVISVLKEAHPALFWCIAVTLMGRFVDKVIARSLVTFYTILKKVIK